MSDAGPRVATAFEYRGRAREVALAGEWGGWAPEAMTRAAGGGAEGDVWALVVALAPGTVRFKFVVDGEWVAAGYEAEADGHGGENCVRVVEAEGVKEAAPAAAASGGEREADADAGSTGCAVM
jgi:hypothetical protein